MKGQKGFMNIVVTVFLLLIAFLVIMALVTGGTGAILPVILLVVGALIAEMIDKRIPLIVEIAGFVVTAYLVGLYLSLGNVDAVTNFIQNNFNVIKYVLVIPAAIFLGEIIKRWMPF